MHSMLSKSRVCDAAHVPLALEATFVRPNAPGPVRGAALHDVKKEAKHKCHSCDLEANGTLISGYLLGANLSNTLVLPVSEFPL